MYKDWEYVINLDECKSIGTQWIALYVNGNKMTYFDSSGVEHISKEIKRIIGKKSIIANIFRRQVYDSMVCGSFCVGFTDLCLKAKV